MKRHSLLRTVCAAALLALLGAGRAAAQDKPMTLAIPGIPPVFGGVIMMVAEQEGFFKKYGANVTVKAFETGAGASRAVVAKQIDIALAPSPLTIAQVSNAGVPLVAIWGMEYPDWLIGSTDAAATCASIKGQPVGVDAVGGARSIALRTLLAGGCKASIDDVQQVALSSNVGAAMIAGQLKYGVLHIDDIPVIEAEAKKPVKTIVTQLQARPVDHYLMLVVHRDTLATRRDQLVRVIAGLIEAEHFMANPANQAKAAHDAAATGRSPELAEKAIKAYLAMEFWPRDRDGLSPNKIKVLSAILKKVGSIKPDKEPATFEQLVDPSLWPAASAMVKR